MIVSWALMSKSYHSSFLFENFYLMEITSIWLSASGPSINFFSNWHLIFSVQNFLFRHITNALSCVSWSNWGLKPFVIFENYTRGKTSAILRQLSKFTDSENPFKSSLAFVWLPTLHYLLTWDTKVYFCVILLRAHICLDARSRFQFEISDCWSRETWAQYAIAGQGDACDSTLVNSLLMT